MAKIPPQKRKTARSSLRRICYRLGLKFKARKDKPMLQIYKDSAGEWRFRIQGSNGEIVATSEGYTRRGDAVRGYEGLLRIVAKIEGRI